MVFITLIFGYNITYCNKTWLFFRGSIFIFTLFSLLLILYSFGFKLKETTQCCSLVLQRWLKSKASYEWGGLWFELLGRLARSKLWFPRLVIEEWTGEWAGLERDLLFNLGQWRRSTYWDTESILKQEHSSHWKLMDVTRFVLSYHYGIPDSSLDVLETL